MGDVDRTIEALCRLPIDFRRTRNVSTIDLVVRSGYPAVASQVTADHVRRYLAGKPDLVDSWFAWSDDQRSSAGWWLAEKSATTYEIGYHDPKRERQEAPLAFDDRVRACAEFIVRAIELIDPSRSVDQLIEYDDVGTS